MAEFTNNFFLSSRAEKNLLQPRSPAARKLGDNKKAVCLLLANIFKAKINKELSFGLGKIMLEALPKSSPYKINEGDTDNQSTFFSTEASFANLRVITSPKNAKQKNLGSNFQSSNKILKKRSSLNQTRPVQFQKISEQQESVKNPERTYQADTDKKDRELNAFKMMQISGSTRSILQKVSRYDKKIYALELQKLCKDQFSEQVKKLEKIKNSSRDMRGQTYDNQLTMTALCNNIKMISELSKQLQQVKKKNEENEKQLKIKRAERERLHRSNQKLEKHLGNVENQMKSYMNRVQEHLSTRDMNKALIGINQFVKKYEDEEFAKEKVYFYTLIKDRIVDYKEIQKCLDEVCRILGVLCIADLNQTDACLRSLNSNHTAFKYIKKTYGNIDKFYGKQMTNIIHNLQKFNNNIIQYLEAKKQIQKQINKPTGIQELKKQHSLQIGALNTKVDEYKRKIALLEVEIEKKNFKLNNLDPVITSKENAKKIQVEFEKKMVDVMNKIAYKKDYKKELDEMRKNTTFSSEKPYSLFMNLICAVQRTNDQKIKQEMQSLSETFNQISKVFKKNSLTQQLRFKQVNQILEASSRKSVFYFDLHRFLQSLMFTIVQNSGEQGAQTNLKTSNEPQINNKVNIKITLPQQKKRERRFSERFDDFKFEIGTIKGGKSCVDRQDSPPKSVGVYDENQQDLGDFDEKDLLKKIELFLNKVSPILHKQGAEMEDKLSQVEELSEKFVLSNMKYKQFFTTIQNWMSFALPRLLKGQ